jgi:tight adherence protein C
MDLMILILVFAATTLLVGSASVYYIRRSLLQRRLRKAIQESASRAAGDRTADAPLTTLAVRVFEKVLRSQVDLVEPRDRWDQSSLRTQLVMAGFRREEAPYLFVAVRIALALLLPAGYLVSLAFFPTPTVKATYLLIALAAAGLYLPLLYLRGRIEKRQRAISRALPNAIDMMMVCVEAGLGLDAAIQRVGEEMELASPEIYEELQLCSLELRAGKPRTDAFRNIALRTGVEEVKSLAALLIQTDRFGTSIASALRAHADGMRTKRRQKLEEAAAKTSVKLIFPLVFFIFPAIMAVMVGPAIIQIARVLFPAISKG